MEPRCRKCGRPLHDPQSIARGMGPSCAGIAPKGRRYVSTRSAHDGSSHATGGNNGTGTGLFSSPEDGRKRVPEVLESFPADLVGLVLSAPEPGSIATCVRKYSRQKENKWQPVRLLKQIRRTCIEHRLPFWPGLSMKSQPIPCIPWGEHDWKIGENGRVINKDELVAYRGRYGIVTRELTQTTV